MKLLLKSGKLYKGFNNSVYGFEGDRGKSDDIIMYIDKTRWKIIGSVGEGACWRYRFLTLRGKFTYFNGEGRLSLLTEIM